MSNNNEQAEKTGERIAKRMASAGLCSRREAERWIADGRVTVNGDVIDSAALNVTDHDDIKVDGETIGKKQPLRLFRYHKPNGLVTSHSDPEGRPTVFDKLPKSLPRVISVGRLDLNSEGLLLLTTSGDLSRQLELPSNNWTRRYRVRAFGRISQELLDNLKEGVIVDGVEYGPIDAVLEPGEGKNRWIQMSLTEGKNREIRNVLGYLGLTVNRLIRIAYGPFKLGDLKQAEIEEIPVAKIEHYLDGNMEMPDQFKKKSGWAKAKSKDASRPWKKKNRPTNKDEDGDTRNRGPKQRNSGPKRGDNRDNRDNRDDRGNYRGDNRGGDTRNRGRDDDRGNYRGDNRGGDNRNRGRDDDRGNYRGDNRGGDTRNRGRDDDRGNYRGDNRGGDNRNRDRDDDRGNYRGENRGGDNRNRGRDDDRGNYRGDNRGRDDDRGNYRGDNRGGDNRNRGRDDDRGNYRGDNRGGDNRNRGRDDDRASGNRNGPRGGRDANRRR